MDKKTIIIIVIAVLVILGLGYWALSFTGFAIAGGVERSCSETDAGNDVFTQGMIVNERGKEYQDYCTSDVQLKEYYCNTRNVINSQKVTCDSKCQDGVCLR